MSESDTMFNEWDQRCTAVQLMLSTDPSYDNRTIVSTLKMQIRTVQHLRAQLNASDDPLEVVERKDTTRKTRTKESNETPQWPIQQIVRDLGVSHTTVNACVKEDLKCRSYRCQTKEPQANQVRQVSLLSQPEPAGLLRLVIRREHHQHHNTKVSLIVAIRRAPISTCGKGMLPVSEPYWGGEWGWRRLHWIDVSSTT